MRASRRLLAAVVFGLATLALPATASAGHDTDPRTKNVHPLGHIIEPGVLGGFGGANPDIQTDIAFWGKHAIQGNWDGFNIRDISEPDNPTTVSRTFCDGNQGDVIVWDDIVVRSWNTAAGTPGAFGAGLTCDGQAVPAGFEGLHVFDISNPVDPVLVASVELSARCDDIPNPCRPEIDAFGCGSHTATGVPDLANGRLLVYNNPSAGGACAGIDIVEVPLDEPASARFLRHEASGRSCHDTGVILGDAMMAACAGGDGFTVWSLADSLVDPVQLYSRTVPTVTIGHSASFTWDGEVLIFGHEPGGGVAAECEATDADEKKSFFFFESDSGDFLGRWTLPRAQGPTENCTLHNYNVVPTRSGRDVLVSGNYQAGTWIVEFTDPANAKTLGWSDPPPKPVLPGTPFCCDVTGAWSSYWYDGLLYETNIGEGLNVFRFSGRETDGALRLRHLNPQTQELTIG
jgi:hypothetical protein